MKDHPGGDVYELLKTLAQRPAPFAVSTIRELWTRPHLAAQMLEHHLSQASEHSSRPIPVIENTVEWIDRQLDLGGKRVIDLGCGPGLYARRMAQRGARVDSLVHRNNLLYVWLKRINRVSVLVIRRHVPPPRPRHRSP